MSKQTAAETAAAAARKKKPGDATAQSAAKPPRGARCMEASTLSRTAYIACGLPATRVVTHLPKSRETYTMCSGCAEHATRNRGARLVLQGESYELTPPAAPKHQAPDELPAQDPGFVVEEAPKEQVVTDDQRKEVVELCRDSVRLERRIELYNRVVARRVAQLQDLKRVVLPERIKEIGMTTVPLTNGYQVKLKQNVGGYIKNDSDERLWKTEAHSVLVAEGEGDVIKRQVVVYFGTGEEDDKWFKKFAADMAKRKKPLNFELKESVHPQTLSKLIREKVRTGQAFDKELFGFYDYTEAVIVPPKEAAKPKAAKTEQEDKL